MGKSNNEEKSKSNNLNSKIKNLKSISKLQTLNSKFHSGITLIALVVTIVVLLILAGVTITLMFGENNIFDIAKEAGDKTNAAIEDEKTAVEGLDTYVKDKAGATGENPDTPTPEEPETPTIPEGLEVGSSVTYNLAGDDYTWEKKYATSDQTGTETLSSKIGGAFRLTQWKVLEINEDTKEVTLVPTAPTTGTVRLQGAQGYNNAVKLLNDSCSKLYGNEAKGITARSIRIEDIEDYMTDNAKTGTNGAHNYTNGDTKYDDQVANAYTSANSKYPVIYAQEIDAVIGNEPRKTTGLGLSDESAYFIERSEGTEGEEVPGSITTATKMQPCQTFWYKDATFMQTAFEPYKEGSTYYSLIMPQGTSTTYWVASRCVSANSGDCIFSVRHMNSGGVSAYSMYYSNNLTIDGPRALFPIVTLSSELLEKGTDGKFSVQL